MMQVEMWEIGRLKPYERNPRKNDHAVNDLAKMISEYGFRVPILARSTGLIIDGHLRLKAAAKLGMTRVPVIPADDMSDEQIRAFRIAVNKTAEWAQWDMEALRFEPESLSEEGFDLTLTGFSLEDVGIIGDDRFQPVGADEQGRLDEKAKHTCPNCGHEF